MATGNKGLKWIQRNLAGGRQPERLGEIAAGVLADRRWGGPAWRRRVLAVLCELGGEALMGRVSGASLRRGVLCLEVADAAALYDLRIRWEQCLLGVIQAEMPGAGVHTIRFVVRGSEH
ncbi:MAG TPA: DciA family protein [Phycisphaerae bacterium]|nr:DciA family protein [Phycisphaerae bacterium]